MRSLLARLPIRHQSDVVAALALIRPGAASGEVKSAFIRRARGEEPDRLPFPMMADRLAETHGLFLYEEDIMVLLARTGGLSLNEADEVRRAIIASGGDPLTLAALEAAFVVRAKAGNAQDEVTARLAWATASRFAAYSFNKAHAASYAFLAYLSAYTKAHHPLQFACAALNHHQGLYPLRTLASDLIRRKIALRPPHVNLSDYESFCEQGEGKEATGAVRVGLDKVKELSRRAAGDILEQRTEGLFRSLKDLLQRVRLSSREIAALILSGACDGLAPLAAADYPFTHEAVLERLRKRSDLACWNEMPIPRPAAAANGRVQLYQGLVRVKNELRYLEMSLLAHPMALLRPEAARYDCRTIAEAVAAPSGRARLAVVVSAMRRVPTKQGPMQFLTVEDETGLLEAAVLPPAYQRIGEVVKTPGPFLVEGKLKHQQGGVHLEVTRLAPFHERDRPFGL